MRADLIRNTVRAVAACVALLLPALGLAGVGNLAHWPAATLDLILMVIVAGSVAYLLYDTYASRRSRQARQQREQVWNARPGHHRRAPGAGTAQEAQRSTR